MNRLLRWGLAVPLAVVLVIFAISNRASVHLDLWPVPAEFDLPVFLSVLLPLLVGVVAGLSLGWLIATPARKQVREQSRRIESLERQLGAVRGRPDGA